MMRPNLPFVPSLSSWKVFASFWVVLLVGLHLWTIPYQHAPQLGFSPREATSALLPNLRTAPAAVEQVADADRLLAGVVWYDTNMDGIPESGGTEPGGVDVNEPGLGRVTLALWLDDGDGRFEPTPALGADTFVSLATTDWTGHYSFNLPASGTYFVDVMDSAQALAGLDLVPGGTADPTSAIAAAGGTVVEPVNFGYVRAADAGQAVLGDRVWLDVDQDGHPDAGEPAIAGVQICAQPSDGAASLCARTDDQGRYRLLLPQGSYWVTVDSSPLGLKATTATTRSLFLLPGTHQLTADFGFSGGGHPTATGLGGTVWQDVAVENGSGDLIADGIQGAGEPGIASVTVAVSLDDGSGLWPGDGPFLTTVTDQNGDYLFGGLSANPYLVRVTDDLNRLRGFEVSAPGPNPGMDGNNQAQPFAIALSGSVMDRRADFGYRIFDTVFQDPAPGPGTVGDLVWWDLDGDGIYDLGNGDQPGAGVTVDIFSNDRLAAVTTTNSEGRYLFAGLAPGVYRVQVSDRFNRLGNALPTMLMAGGGTEEGNHSHPYDLALGLSGLDHRQADFGFRSPLSSLTLRHLPQTKPPVRMGEKVRFSVQITNTGSTWIATLPLQIVHDTNFLRFESASVTPDSFGGGRIQWADLSQSLSDLAPAGQPNNSVALVLTYTALADTGRLANFTTGVSALLRGVQVDADGPDGPMIGTSPLAPASAQAGMVIIAPTAVLLDGAVYLTEQGVAIEWRTSSEINLAGFNLWRRGEDGAAVPLNGEIIPAQHPGQAVGGAYRWEIQQSNGADSLTQDAFSLEILMADGTVQQKDLGTAQIGVQIFLPLILR